MKTTKTFCLFLFLAFLCSFSFPRYANATGTRSMRSNIVLTRERTTAAAPESAGLREIIADKYKSRYEAWKKEFLSTDIGRAQWDMYAHHPRLVLTITISRSNPQVATTGKYKWNDSGELIAATITLGSQADHGYPSAVYYRVMNAL